MARLTTTYNVCPGCGAAVGQRAATCVLCDAPLPRAGRRSASQRTPQASDTLSAQQQALWRELATALSPAIRIVGYLDEGGMGSVFLGYDVSLKREVAVKVMAPELSQDDVARERFQREAEASGGVSHPNVVAIHQVGLLRESGAPYFVMQFVEGPTLQHAVDARRVLSEPRVRRILRDVAAGLAAAHRRGVVHRDIKPGNVVLEAETGRALVLDFGIAAALDARRTSGAFRLTTEGMYLGTPMYMSPEQAGTGAVSDRSDIYSLGIVAFELLTGRPPFAAPGAVALMAAHLKEPAPRIDAVRGDVSLELALLIDRCLAKDPDVRPTAQAIVDFLDPAGTSAIAWPPPGLERARGTGARCMAAAALLGAALLVFFLLLHRWPASIAAAHADRSPLAVLAIVVFMLVGTTIGTASRAARMASRGRAAGYPWPVVLEVLGDRRRDTEALMNGRSTYALADDALRARFLRLRRIEGVLLACGALSAITLPVLWLLAPGDRASAGDQLVTRAELLLLWAPPSLLFLAALAARLPETRWRRHRAAESDGEDTRPGVRAELVRSWLASARRGSHAPGRAPLRSVTVGAMLLVGAGVAATVALTVYALFVSSALAVQPRVNVASDAQPNAQPAAALQVASDACTNPRELLFGPDPRRRAQVVALGEAMRSDDPRRRGVALALRWLDHPREFGTPDLRSRADRSGGTSALAPALRVAGSMGPAGLRERLRYCGALLRR